MSDQMHLIFPSWAEGRSMNPLLEDSSKGEQRMTDALNAKWRVRETDEMSDLCWRVEYQKSDKAWDYVPGLRTLHEGTAKSIVACHEAFRWRDARIELPEEGLRDE